MQEWGSAILIVLFLVLTVKIFQHHVVLPHNTVHGAALLGAFVLMVTISLSEGISWASYASDYSRYMKPDSSKAAIFWYTMAGLTASYVWVETIGLAAASVLSNQTAAGVRTLMGGGFLGVLALIAIVFGAIASNSMNDYTGSLAFQALGARVKRPIIAAVVAVLAFARHPVDERRQHLGQVREPAAVHLVLDRAVLRDRDDRLALQPGQVHAVVPAPRAGLPEAGQRLARDRVVRAWRSGSWCRS